MFAKTSLFAMLIASLVSPRLLNAGSCTNNQVKLQILGSGGPELNDKRASSSYLVWINNKASFLVDAGSGSSYHYEKTAAKFEDLKAILLTHLHVDHSADIPAYIKASFFTGRNTDLLIFGPDGNKLMPSTEKFIQLLLGKRSAFRYLSDYLDRQQKNDYHIVVKNVPLRKNELFRYTFSSRLKIKATVVHHGPVAAIAWRIEIDKCSLTFSGDMNNAYRSIATLAKNTDLFIAHNAVPESATGVAAFLHMRPSTIGKISHKARVKKLILSHRMNRTIGREKETLNIIRKYYKARVQFANDLDIFKPK